MEKYEHQHEMGDIEGPSTWQLRADMMIKELRRDQNEFLARLREAASNRYKALPIQVEVETPRHKEMEDVHEELPTQPEAETPRRQEVENVHQEHQSKVSTGPVLARRPTQNYQRVPTLHQRLQKAQYLSNQERQMRWMAEHNSALDRSKLRDTERKLHEEKTLRLKREEEVQMLKEQIKSFKSLSPRVLPAEPMAESANIKDFKGQLQTEVLKKQQEVRAPFIETVSKDLGLVQSLQEENAALKKEMEKVKRIICMTVTTDLELVQCLEDEKAALKKKMEDMKDLQREACKEVTARQLEDLRRQQEEKTKFYLKLVQSLQEEKASLKNEMEDMKRLQREACKEDGTACQLEDLKRQQDEKTKSDLELVQSLQEENAGLEEEAYQVLEKKLELFQQQKDSSEKQKKPSRWRRFKKSITPNPLRKNKKKDQE